MVCEVFFFAHGFYDYIIIQYHPFCSLVLRFYPFFVNINTTKRYIRSSIYITTHSEIDIGIFHWPQLHSIPICWCPPTYRHAQCCHILITVFHALVQLAMCDRRQKEDHLFRSTWNIPSRNVTLAFVAHVLLMRKRKGNELWMACVHIWTRWAVEHVGRFVHPHTIRNMWFVCVLEHRLVYSYGLNRRRF